MIRSTQFLSLIVATAALLVGCERPPITTVQHGYRGTGMELVSNPRTAAKLEANNVAPPVQAPASAEGPKASAIFQNVKVLGDLSAAQFTGLMVSMTSWVAPKEGCNYCHNPANLADDSKYTKVVARRMIQMTQHVNADWKSHVASTGVTCYTCHRGNPVPQNVWFNAPELKQSARLTGDKAGQNTPAKTVAWSSLPYDPFTPYLQQTADIRVNGTQALPHGNKHSIKQTEHTYGLMMHMSDALGVNCTFCHNSRQFSSWEQSPPQRATAWHGIKMARDLNLAYMEPLTPVFPQDRLGPKGDVAKVNCATCHQGVNKPLNGVSMLKGHPELGAPLPAAMVAAVAAANTPAAAPAASAPAKK